MSFYPAVSVIIPCYNEGKLILPVIREVLKSKLVTEVIVVDDGSNLFTKEVLCSIKNIKIITHPYNLGKSAALKTGVLASKSDYIAFVDSDLKNFKANHLNRLLLPVLKGEYDITLSDRDKESWYTRISNFSIAFTGDRVINRKLLLDNFDVFDQSGYIVEAAMNQRFFGQVRISKVKFTGVSQQSKSRKFGFFPGYFKDFKMLLNYIMFLGCNQLISQLIYTGKLGYC